MDPPTRQTLKLKLPPPGNCRHNEKKSSKENNSNTNNGNNNGMVNHGRLTGRLPSRAAAATAHPTLPQWGQRYRRLASTTRKKPRDTNTKNWVRSCAQSPNWKGVAHQGGISSRKKKKQKQVGPGPWPTYSYTNRGQRKNKNEQLCNLEWFVAPVCSYH